MYGYSISKSTSLKKRALYKAGMYLLAFSLAFTAYIQSERKAEAFVWGAAIPGGITIGAGAYVIGALGLAGMVGLIGYDEHGDAIRAHGQQVWKDGTQTAMDSLNYSIEMAKGAGNGIVNLQSDFMTFIDGKLMAISANVDNTLYPKTQFETIPGITHNITNTGIGLNIDNTKNFYLYKNGLKTGNVLASLSISVYTDGKMTFSTQSGVVAQTTISTTYESMRTRVKAITSLLGLMSFAQANFGGDVYQVKQNDLPLNTTGDQILTKVRESWQDMKDAGLVLPVDSAVPINAETGDPLTYNPDADTYTGIDGGVYTGVPQWLFPQPKIRTGNPDIPDGVYVDTPVVTGNPAYDTPILENPAIPKTTTNINTGITTANPDIPLTPTPTPTPTPEPTPTPKPLPRIPNSAAPVPALVLLAFFDLLRALLMYLVRMFNWIMTIPFIDEKPIDNPYFQWFRQAKILGVYPYTLVTGMATFFLGFKLVKAVRSFLP